MVDCLPNYRMVVRDCLVCGSKELEVLVRIRGRKPGSVLFLAESTQCKKCGSELSDAVVSMPIFCKEEMMVWQEEEA